MPHSQNYSAIATNEDTQRSRSSPLVRTMSGDSKQSAGRHSLEPGMHPAIVNDLDSYPTGNATDSAFLIKTPAVSNEDIDENSSLMSKSSTSTPGDVEGDAAKMDKPAHDPHHLDIRGMALLPKVEFWLLFSMLGLLTGIGLMTIK